MTKAEDLKVLLDLYLYSEIDDEKALDIFLAANNIDFKSSAKPSKN